MSKLMENLIKNYNAQAIERKDISLKDLVAKEGKADKNGLQTMEIEVTGLASKLVPKYQNANNYGMHTMVYLADKRKTGAFSNALFDFAKFFYASAGMDTDSDFNKLEFGGSVKISVSVIPLDGGKSTYNFEIVGGEVGAIQAIAGSENLLIEDK